MKEQFINDILFDMQTWMKLDPADNHITCVHYNNEHPDLAFCDVISFFSDHLHQCDGCWIFFRKKTITCFFSFYIDVICETLTEVTVYPSDSYLKLLRIKFNNNNLECFNYVHNSPPLEVIQIYDVSELYAYIKTHIYEKSNINIIPDYFNKIPLLISLQKVLDEMNPNKQITIEI